METLHLTELLLTHSSLPFSLTIISVHPSLPPPPSLPPSLPHLCREEWKEWTQDQRATKVARGLHWAFTEVGRTSYC